VSGEGHRPLLHNMSAPPKTVVKYSGLAEQNESGTSGELRLKSSKPVLNGQPVRFVLQPKFVGQGPEKILRLLKIELSKQFSTSESQLIDLINQCADSLPLPEGCAVIAADISHEVIWPDTLSALAILSKCTDSIWLRSKSPSLVSIRDKNSVSLLVPHLFTKHFYKVKNEPIRQNFRLFS